MPNIIQKKRASTLINIELLKNWNEKNKIQKISKQKLTLFENLDVFKVSKFFDKYSYFDITTEYYNEDIMDDMYYMDDY